MSFGSFHTSSYLTQDAAPEDQYKPYPLPPVNFPKFTEKTKFGAEMKDKHFLLDKEWTFINHGSSGALLKEALEAETAWKMYVESQPVRFIDRELFPQMVHAVTRVAKFIDAEKTDVVFVQNATTAINAVIQSVIKTFQPGDSILMTNITYGSVQKLLGLISEENRIRIDEVSIDPPLQSKEHIVQLIKDAIKPDTKFAVIDHISSSHAFVLPIKEIVAMCHEQGVQVLVDAAHCFGSMPISMKDIGADYYVINAHKWFCSSKGCAALYVDRAHQSVIRPLVVSWGFECGFSAEFGWTGLMNYTSYLSIHTVLDFWEFYGPDNIRSYLYETARDAGELLTKSWGTQLLDDSSWFCAMVMVELPEGVVRADIPLNGDETVYSYKHAVGVQDTLFHDFKIEVPVKVQGGKLYVRISAHIYNTMSDYQRLADAINKIRLTE